MPVKYIPSHPIADAFPMMEGSAYRELVEDIRKNGQLAPIFLFEGKILDGRNRYQACIELDTEPVTREFDGTYEEAVSYVASLNIHRRHLTASQRSQIASNLRAMAEGGQLSPSIPSLAKQLNVSEKQIDRAVNVQRNTVPEVSRAVTDGKLTVHAAQALIPLPPEEQRRIVELPKPEIRQAIRELSPTRMQDFDEELVEHDLKMSGHRDSPPPQARARPDHFTAFKQALRETNGLDFTLETGSEPEHTERTAPEPSSIDESWREFTAGRQGPPTAHGDSPITSPMDSHAVTPTVTEGTPSPQKQVVVPTKDELVDRFKVLLFQLLDSTDFSEEEYDGLWDEVVEKFNATLDREA